VRSTAPNVRWSSPSWIRSAVSALVRRRLIGRAETLSGPEQGAKRGSTVGGLARAPLGARAKAGEKTNRLPGLPQSHVGGAHPGQGPSLGRASWAGDRGPGAGRSGRAHPAGLAVVRHRSSANPTPARAGQREGCQWPVSQKRVAALTLPGGPNPRRRAAAARPRRQNDPARRFSRGTRRASLSRVEIGAKGLPRAFRFG
jgi:hypothetical protein